MGLFNRFKRSGGGGQETAESPGEGHSGAEDQEADKKKKKLKTRRKSFFQFISPSDVTTESLQVWAGLPSKIRQDPSMASFQLECDRLHGENYLILTTIEKFFQTSFSLLDEGLDIEVNNEETAIDNTLNASDEKLNQMQPNGVGEEEDQSEFIIIMTPPVVENENEIRFNYKNIYLIRLINSSFSILVPIPCKSSSTPIQIQSQSIHIVLIRQHRPP